MRLQILAILFLTSLCHLTHAQTRAERLADAIALFNNAKYEQARVALAAIAAEPERDPKVNFYLGAAQAMTATNPDDAIRRLRIAQARAFMKNEANLYIGRAYQFTCDYEQARAALEKFLAQPSSPEKAALARQYDAECAAAINIASKIFNIKVVAKTTLAKDDILNAYGISREVGSLCHNADFFQSDIDPKGLMYTTERADAAYFSMPDDTGRDKLMKMEKLIGGWGDMVRLQGLDSDDPSDDIAPVLLTDGQTLFFASNRPGGMGGYDIYRATYDHETRTFSQPINMGVPFNSPFDDFLFVPDEFAMRTWFASNRETHNPDTVTVYQIVWDDTVLRTMAQTTDEIRQALALPLDASAGAPVAARKTTTAAANTQSGKKKAKNKDAFRFVICDTLTYTQWEHFRNPQAKSAYRLAMAAAAEKDSTIRIMAAQRKEFMGLTSTIERNAKLQDLLQTERSIYALDDEVTEKSEFARNEEIKTISELIASHKYTPLCAIKIKTTEEAEKSSSPDAWLSPEAFSSFSPVFFSEARANADEDVMDILSGAERTTVTRQDSLLAWVQIVNMEADKSEPDVATKLRKRATTLAVGAYDTKCQAYESAAARLFPTIKGYDTGELKELYDKAHALRIAIAAQTPTDDPVAPRRRASVALERCLSRYAAHASGVFPLPDSTPDTVMPILGDVVPQIISTPEPAPECEVKPAETPAPQATEPQPAAQPEPEPAPAAEPGKEETKAEPQSAPETPAATAKAPAAEPQPVATPTPEATQTAQAANFRIQLGVFRKTPTALQALPDPSAVTSLYLEERDLTRYYYGAYASQAAAKADLDMVHAAGFDGAFVVKADK